MDNKEKLKRAQEAMFHLEQAILTMQQPSQKYPKDPDYDLWRAFKELKAIDDALQPADEPEFNDNDSDEVKQLISQGR